MDIIGPIYKYRNDRHDFYFIKKSSSIDVSISMPSDLMWNIFIACNDLFKILHLTFDQKCIV